MKVARGRAIESQRGVKSSYLEWMGRLPSAGSEMVGRNHFIDGRVLFARNSKLTQHLSQVTQIDIAVQLDIAIGMSRAFRHPKMGEQLS